MPIRECIDLAHSNRDTMGWETELQFLYHKVVVEQGTTYTAASCQLVAATRRAYGLDLAIATGADRSCHFDGHWKGELYLALLLTHRRASRVDEARADLPPAAAQGLCGVAAHLDMARTIGDATWRDEVRRLEAHAHSAAEALPPQQRKRVRTGAGALPYVSTGRALESAEIGNFIISPSKKGSFDKSLSPYGKASLHTGVFRTQRPCSSTKLEVK